MFISSSFTYSEKEMPINNKILKRKQPFSHLDNEALDALARSAVITYHNKGDIIFAAGDNDDKSAFLVLGEVLLRSIDGRVQKVHFLDEESSHSLANVKPRRYTAIAKSHDTCLLWIQNQILELVMNKSNDMLESGIISEIIPDRRHERRV